jgi:hypothetical protein
MLDEFQNSLQRMTAVLRSCGIRFAITGGVAYVVYGDPRTTYDVDLVVDGERLRECIPTFVVSLKQHQFLLNENAIREALRKQRRFHLIDAVSTIRLDLYPGELISGVLDRVVEIDLFPGVPLPIVARRDLAVCKLIWIRKGSHHSRRDLKQILIRAAEEETATVRETAAKLSLLDLLDEVLAEPDEIDA